jgi:uncharacterized protein
MAEMDSFKIPSYAPTGFHLLSKPTGAICNLDCKYCFFLSKEALYPGSNFRMNDDMLDKYIKQLLESHTAPEVNVAWQGGEPMLMGIDFFKKSVELVDKYKRPDQRIMHSIQTNGVLIDDEWAEFFHKNKYLVGLSVDGPKEIHDEFRVNKGGKGTFDQVMRGWQFLVKHNVEFNILCTLHSANINKPLEVYKFFRDEMKAEYLQFIPIIERATEETLPVANQGWSERPGGERPLYIQKGDIVTERSVKAEEYGDFYISIFEEWVRRDVGKVYIQMFDVTLGTHVGQYSLCIHSPNCGTALAMEHNGDMYSCDHFVEPDYMLGNINDTHMIELVASAKQKKFGTDKQDTLPKYCRDCSVKFSCNGGCPKDRFINTPDGEAGLNYLCAGYKNFFNHVTKPMQTMAELIKKGRFADEIMEIYNQGDQKVMHLFETTGRNDMCPCGSGKKFKHCHGINIE